MKAGRSPREAARGSNNQHRSYRMPLTEDVNTIRVQLVDDKAIYVACRKCMGRVYNNRLEGGWLFTAFVGPRDGKVYTGVCLCDCVIGQHRREGFEIAGVKARSFEDLPPEIRPNALFTETFEDNIAFADKLEKQLLQKRNQTSLKFNERTETKEVSNVADDDGIPF